MTSGLRGANSGGAALVAAMTAACAAYAQESGGLLRVHALDPPPSLSMHEEVDANPARVMRTRSNCNPTVAKTPLAQSHRLRVARTRGQPAQL